MPETHGASRTHYSHYSTKMEVYQERGTTLQMLPTG